MRKNVEKKSKQAEELSSQIKKYKTVILINLRKTSTRLLQRIRKLLKEKYNAYVKIHRKAVLQHAFKQAGLPEEVWKNIDFPGGVVLINESPYKVALLFMKNKMDTAAKPGDVAPFDIIVPAGETDLPPGPTLSQLKAAGINVKIDKGKIVVAKDSVVAKAGDVITDEKASALQTLGVKPFKVGMNVSYAYDGETVFTQEVLSLPPEDVEEGLRLAIGQALNASINAAYPTRKNIEFLLKKALKQGLNAGLNASFYSESTIKYLLQKALAQGNALKHLEGGSQ